MITEPLSRRDYNLVMQAVSGLRQELLQQGAVRSNPYGADSNLAVLSPARLQKFQGLPYFPSRVGADRNDYDDAYWFSRTASKYQAAYTDKLGRFVAAHKRPINGALIMKWGGPVMESQQEYGPAFDMTGPDGQAVRVSWAGRGWDLLKRMALIDPAFTGTARRRGRTIEGELASFSFQDLTPWGPSNPSGTGIWNVAAKLVRERELRKDEVFVARTLMEAIGLTLASLAAREIQTGQPVSRADLREAKAAIADALDALLIALFGTVDPFALDAIDDEGKKAIEEYAAQKEAERARKGEKKGGAPLTGMAMLQALGRK